MKILFCGFPSLFNGKWLLLHQQAKDGRVEWLSAQNAKQINNEPPRHSPHAGKLEAGCICRNGLSTVAMVVVESDGYLIYRKVVLKNSFFNPPLNRKVFRSKKRHQLALISATACDIGLTSCCGLE